MTQFSQLAFILLLAISSLHVAAQTFAGPQGEKFTSRIVARRLSNPWEITYGPDSHLWVTEARSYVVSRIDPATGVQSLLLDLSKARNFPRYDVIPDQIDGGKPWPQGGLMGLALHPRLLSGQQPASWRPVVAKFCTLAAVVPSCLHWKRRGCRLSPWYQSLR